MRIRGYRRIRELIVDQKARRFVASLDRSDYVIPDEVKERLRGKLKSMLDENIVPFWFPHCLDLSSGGYLAECSLKGEWQPFRDKNIISQSRTLWFASRLITFGRTSDENIRWAQHGFAFLKDHFWDDEHGGFFWEINYESKRPTKPNKHLCGQAFALYALSEFVLATGDSEARSMADRLFELLDHHAHDARHGGYIEYFARDWTRVHSKEPHYMGHPPDIKQVNTHVHLLEAFTLYARLADSELVRTRLTELVLIQSSAVVRKEGGGCTDVHTVDWQHFDKNFARVTYGHDLENVWLLIEANRALGVSNTPLVELYEHLFLSAVRYGWDRANGGFYFRGPLRKSANQRFKPWWAQAEALLCALQMYRLTGRAMYFQIFEQTLNWIDRQQIDWAGGEWYHTIDEDGSVSGSKASDANGAWKTPYHSGRAVIHCLELLADL